MRHFRHIAGYRRILADVSGARIHGFTLPKADRVPVGVPQIAVGCIVVAHVRFTGPIQSNRGMLADITGIIDGFYVPSLAILVSIF